MSGKHGSVGKDSGQGDASGLLPLLAFAFFVLAVKLYLIATYASPIPFGDQWNGEAQTLLRPFMTKQLGWSQLVAPFNEHRILTTRLLDLLLLVINGNVWSPLLEIVVNAFLHVLALTILLLGLVQACPRPYRVIVLVFSAVIFAIPFGIENTLWGFQSQFYFELLFSFCFIWALCLSRPLGLPWWGGIVAAVLAALSLASGPISLLAGVLVLLVRAAKGGGRGLPDLLLGVGVLAFALWIVAIMPVVPGDAGARVASVGDFFMACLTALSWPALPGFALLIYLPFFLFSLRLLRAGAPVEDHAWFVFGIGLWVLGQVAVLGFGRSGADMLASRYMDVFVVGLPLNLACVFINKQGAARAVPPGETVQPPYMPYEQLWLLLVLGFGLALAPRLVHFAGHSRGVEQVELGNVRAYLETGNDDYVLKVAFPAIPFPDPVLLKEQLDSATVRYILPPALIPANASRQNAGVALLLGHTGAVALLSLLAALTSLGVLFSRRKLGAAV